MKNEDMEYLDENFPKGDKKRGVAMVLLAIARREGKYEAVKEYEEFLDDYKKEQRELVRQEVLSFIDKYSKGKGDWYKYYIKIKDLKKELSA